MGNRMLEDVCLGCGSPIIVGLENEYRCCTKCTEKIMREIHRTKVKSEKGKGKSMPKTFRLNVPAEPLGEDVPKY